MEEKVVDDLTHCPLAELRYICKTIDFPNEGTKSSILDTLKKNGFNYSSWLQDQLEKIDISVLKKICDDFGFKKSKKKQDMINQIIEHEEFVCITKYNQF